MKSMTAVEIFKMSMGKSFKGSKETLVTGVSTDTRTLKPGELFIPLCGERFDGHNYIKEAFERGASGIISSKPYNGDLEGKFVIYVNDTLKALGDIAKSYRGMFKPITIGVTGSVGKTTTKDLISSILSTKMKTLKTRQNYNNEIGVPLTLLELDSSYEALIVEMGMRGRGQISYLVDIAKPNIGVVTSVTEAHVELLGSIEEIALAKAELVEGIERDGTVVLNADDDRVLAMAGVGESNKLLYGISRDKWKDIDIYVENINLLGEDGFQFTLNALGEKHQVHFPLPGKHNLSNALAACGVGLAAGMKIYDIIQGLRKPDITRMRSQILNTNYGVKIINDTYNSCPESVYAGIMMLNDLVKKEQRKIAVLGDMLELGSLSIEGHRKVGRFVSQGKIDVLLTVGDKAKDIAIAARSIGKIKTIIECDTNEQASSELRNLLVPGDVVFIKGSRGMEMEKIVETLV